MCQTQNKEMDFIKILQSTSSYELSNGKLILRNTSGEELIFKK
ncbi:MAG: META domain-containing protein [Flavobacterium sp.]|nr:META domain-containing protein [Flavobacterium sp.]